MHPYSLDTLERKNILLFLGLASIVLTLIFYQILNTYKIILYWWIESPSILFFYGLLYTFFDKWSLRLGLTAIPDLNGEWKGYLSTSFNKNATREKAILKIFQSWSEIKIVLATDNSSSYSEVASLAIKPPEGKYLSYQYINEPSPSAAQTMNIHRGTARLILNKEMDSLSGEYYSGRNRQNFGSLYFKRSKK